MEIIKSVTNQKVKLLKSLQQKKYRDIHGLYVVEGFNVLKDIPHDKYVKEYYVSQSKFMHFKDFLSDKKAPISILEDYVFDFVCVTKSPIGILALMNQKSQNSVALATRAFFEADVAKATVLVLDRIRDPGNLGTILRSAAAFGVDIILSFDSSELYNPKTVRAAMGAIHHIDFVVVKAYENFKELLKGYTVAYLDMEGKNIYDFKRPDKLAVVVGNEADGVSDFLKSMSNASLSIPMPGNNLESLNAAVSASIALSVLTSK